MNTAAMLLAMTVSAGPVPIGAPFLFVRFDLPAKANIAYYPGTTAQANVAPNVTVGLRPGYVHRVEVTGLPGAGSLPFYPSLEVRGTLQPRENFRVDRHPIPLTLTAEDVARMLDGRLVTKYYFLEDPAQAINVDALPPGAPLELRYATEREALAEATKRGRPILVMRVGERGFTREELNAENVLGTVLLPGATSTPVPMQPPILAYGGIPLYDPLLGPPGPDNLECLHDGGDGFGRLAVGADGKLRNLDPSDTSMEFTTSKSREVIASNRVCICVPRFAAATFDTVPILHHVAQGPNTDIQIVNTVGVKHRVPAITVIAREQANFTNGRLRPNENEGIQTLIVSGTLMGLPQIIGTRIASNDTTGTVVPQDLTAFPGCRVQFNKSMEPENPQRIGEIVTFTLRFANPTAETFRDVIISDSLTGRLQYIEESAKSSRPAAFTTVPNAAGSVTLRWALDKPLKPGDTGAVTFRAKIR